MGIFIFFALLPWWLITLDVIAAGICIGTLAIGAKEASGIIFLLMVIATFIFSPVNPVLWMFEHPLTTIGLIAVYAFIGIVWGPIRWKIYLRSDSVQANYKYQHDNFLQYQKNYPSYTKSFEQSDYWPFSYKQDSGMIISWVVIWPLSMIWTATDQFIFKLWNNIWTFLTWIGHYFASIYASIASSEVNKVLAEKEKDK